MIVTRNSGGNVLENETNGHLALALSIIHQRARLVTLGLLYSTWRAQAGRALKELEKEV